MLRVFHNTQNDNNEFSRQRRAFGIRIIFTDRWNMTDAFGIETLCLLCGEVYFVQCPICNQHCCAEAVSHILMVEKELILRYCSSERYPI